MKNKSDIDQLIDAMDERELDPSYPIGYKDCVVGMVERFGMQPVILVDKTKMLRKMVSEGMTEEEAEEYFDFNVVGAWMGENTPAFVTFTKDHLRRYG